MAKVNYFEVLRITDQASDEDVRLAKTSAADYWQKMEIDAIDNKMRTQARDMRRYIDEAYAALSSVEARKRYKDELTEINQKVSSKKFGAIEIKVRTEGGFNDLNFTVVENPVSNPLVIDNLQIHSIQEFVCRSYEKPEQVALVAYQDRSLERWLYYSAQETDIPSALKYYRWLSNSLSDQQLAYLALDLMQARYPAPIIPRSEPTILEQLKQYERPDWVVVPAIVNFDLLPNKTVTHTLFVRGWKTALGEIQASVNSPLVKLDTTQLSKNGQILVSVNGADIKGGETLQAVITLESPTLGKKQIPVYGIRYKWLGLFNQGNARDFNLRVAAKFDELSDFGSAAALYLEAGATSEASAAAKREILSLAKQHLWQSVVEKSTDFRRRFGRDTEVTIQLVEALRLIGGSFYQLQQYVQAIDVLTKLVVEWNFLPDKKLPTTAWTSKKESQIDISAINPKHAWVDTAENLGLTWTHPKGSADKSAYAGQRPMTLENADIIWSAALNLKPPLIATKGILVARRKDNKAVLGIDATSGEILWQHVEGLASGRDIAEPVSHDEQVFIADAEGVIYCLNIVSGAVQWKQPLENRRDINLAFDDGLLMAATGDQVIFLDTKDGGKPLASTSKMRGLFGGANPTNLLLTDGYVAFQKATMFKKSMQFLNAKIGNGLEFDIPNSMTPPAAWAASHGFIFIPTLITTEARTPDLVRTYQDGRREIVTYRTLVWDSLEINVFHVNQPEVVAYIRDIVPGARGSTYLDPITTDDRITTTTRSVDVVSVAPLGGGSTDRSVPFTEYKPGDELAGFVVGVGVGKYVYYCVMVNGEIDLLYTLQEMDSPVQAIIFNAVDDVIVTQKSLTVTHLGIRTTGGSYEIPSNLRPIVGHPAMYGSILYFINGAGQLVAIGK